MEKATARGLELPRFRCMANGVYTVPGDGMVDFVSVFKELPGYCGWVVVEAEQDPKKANPLAYAKMGDAHLKQALNAGLASLCQGSRSRDMDAASPCRSSSSNRRAGCAGRSPFHHAGLRRLDLCGLRRLPA